MKGLAVSWLFSRLQLLRSAPRLKPGASSGVDLRDITQQAAFRLGNNGAFAKVSARDARPGVAYIDYDNDGFPDIFSSTVWTGPGTCRNTHRSSFTTITTAHSRM